MATTGVPGRRPSGNADRRRHRLVQMENVEALPLEDPADARDRRWTQDDVRQRVVGGDDHRPSDGNDVGRRLAVAAEARVQQRA